MRFTLFLVFITFLSACCGPNCTCKQQESVISERLSVVEFQAKMNELDNEILIDVRTAEEIQENGSIDDALNYDIYGESFENQIALLDTLQPVMVFCRSGGRSADAAAILQEQGFNEIYDLEVGYSGWLEEMGE